MKKIFTVLAAFMAINIANAQSIEGGMESIEQALKHAVETDQAYRWELKKTTTSEERAAQWQKIRTQDSINRGVVFPIVDKLIAGEIEGLSKEGYNSCFLVIQHADLDAQLKYYDFIVDCFKAKRISDSSYIVFVDRVNVEQNKAQLFGSQCVEIPNEAIVPYPVKEQSVRDSVALGAGLNPRGFSLVGGMAVYLPVELPRSEIEKIIAEGGAKEGVTLKIKDQYNFIEVAEDEFAIIGIIYSEKSKKNGIAGAVVKIDNVPVATSDANGYFAYKVPKNNIPDEVAVSCGGKDVMLAVDAQKRNGDFILFFEVIE